MDDENSILCKHESNSQEKEVNFCPDCGSILSKNIYALKPFQYNYKVEINPFIIFHNMLFNSTFLLKFKNKYYLVKRSEIIQNLFHITQKLKFSKQSLYIAISYMDYILFSMSLDIKYELLGLCCLIIATKFNENDPRIPDLKEIQNLYPKMNFSVDLIRKYEFLCLKALGYNLRIFTAYHFICFFANCGYVFSDDIITPVQSPSRVLVKKKSNSTIPSVNITISSNTNQNDEGCLTKTAAQNSSVDKIYESTKEILSYFIEDYQYNNYTQLQIACSCIVLSRDINRIKEFWPETLVNVFKIKLEDFKDCLDTIKSVISKRKTNNVEIASYLSHRQQLYSNNLANTPISAHSIHKKSLESNKLSNTMIIPNLYKKSTLSVIKPHSSKYSIEQKECKKNKQTNASESFKKTFKNLDKDCEEIIKSKIENPKPISINLALKKVYNSNISEKNSLNESIKNKKKQKSNYSSNQVNKLSVIINEYKSNDNKNHNIKKNNKKMSRKNGKSTTILYDLSKHKDISLVNISLNQITSSNSGILTNRTARVDLKNYQSVNGGTKQSDLIQQNTTRAESRKFSISKLDNLSNKNSSASKSKDYKNYNKIPKSFKIDLNDIGNEIIKNIKI